MAHPPERDGLRVIFVLVEKPRYVYPTISLEIRINIHRIGIWVTLLILGVEAALNVRPITVVIRVISLLIEKRERGRTAITRILFWLFKEPQTGIGKYHLREVLKLMPRGLPVSER
jgi:hypothetical protein